MTHERGPALSSTVNRARTPFSWPIGATPVGEGGLRYTRVSRDLSQPGVVRELQELGYSVADCAAVGDDFPDLLLGKHGIDQLVELKTEDRRRNGPVHASQLLRPGQREFRNAWRGGRVIVAYSAREIHELFCARLNALKVIP